MTVLETAGLSYNQVTFWNAVPWAGPREEKITQIDLAKGASMMARLLPLLPRLQSVVLVGEVAGTLRLRVQWPDGVEVMNCAHPGPIVWNQHRYRVHKQGIFAAFERAATTA